jgi:hypothetical protein
VKRGSRFYFSSITDFDPAVLVSSLRIATNFDHPALRQFAIDHLELKELPPMDYLPFAREFNVPDWEARALDHLAIRAEPVTVAEAELLGTESFVAMIVRREQRLAHNDSLSKLSTDNAAARTSGPKSSSVEEVIDLCDDTDDWRGFREPSPSAGRGASPTSYPRTRSRVRKTRGSKVTSSAKRTSSRSGVTRGPAKRRR